MCFFLQYQSPLDLSKLVILFTWSDGSGCFIAIQSNPAIPGGVSRDFERSLGKGFIAQLYFILLLKLWPCGLAEISLSITQLSYFLGLHKNISLLPLYFKQRELM